MVTLPIEYDLSYQDLSTCYSALISRPSSTEDVYRAIEELNKQFPNIRYAMKFYLILCSLFIVLVAISLEILFEMN